MCGIVGFWSPSIAPERREKLARSMAGCLRHRGPDSDGVWLDEQAGITLGHRRLAIVDLSPAGAQPMLSESGRWVIVLNGEIYNYRDLHRELFALGHHFRGSSDTEVLLAAVEQWGIREAIGRCAGMFALALWDRRDRQLVLVRDRMGEKPLFVARHGESVLFASELKAFLPHPHFKKEINRTAVADLLRYSYVPNRSVIYNGVSKVAPGHFMTFDLSNPDHRDPVVTQYWSAPATMTQGASNRIGADVEGLIDLADSELRRTISEEMVADVPLGAFLSGGIDSTLVVALMQAISPGAVRTFTIGFDTPSYNEAHFAKAVAEHLGTDHTEHYVSASEAMGIIELLPAIYDEPFADASQIPTYLVSRLAREHVTVALSGDGGDEVFAGYNRYAWMERIWQRVSPFPMSFRRGASYSLNAVPPETWDRLGAVVARAVPGLRMRGYGDKAHKLARLLSKTSKEHLYEEIISAWPEPGRAMRGAEGSSSDATPAWQASGLNFTEQMMLADMIGYLPDDILVKVDRAAMAVSLETRAPFIDHRIVEFASRLPFNVKVRGGRSKWILRALLDRYVPASLIERPKMGFGVPLDHWTRGDLRQWATRLLDRSRVTMDGFFDADVVQHTWQAHLDGRINGIPQLWPILMFNAWLEHQA